MARKVLGPEAIEIGRNIRRERERCGFTGDRVRELTSIHPTSLSFIERGMQEPSGEQLRALALAFNVPLTTLLGSTLEGVKPPRREKRSKRAA